MTILFGFNKIQKSEFKTTIIREDQPTFSYFGEMAWITANKLLEISTAIPVIPKLCEYEWDERQKQELLTEMEVQKANSNPEQYFDLILAPKMLEEAKKKGTKMSDKVLRSIPLQNFAKTRGFGIRIDESDYYDNVYYITWSIQ
jgi:hypothetical protein